MKTMDQTTFEVKLNSNATWENKWIQCNSWVSYV